ncbi:hypothetical protein AB0E67_16810 [Streptomyces sp. NPDC032161]|uniref:hypothetical protein n=1 Tax=unclassified Streptomyces TaxID=2593676 RepID=UPI003409D101
MASASAQDLAAALRRRTLEAAAAAPAVRGANWRMATVATVSASGTVTTTDGIVARRLESYTNPAPGDLIRIDVSAAGSWTTPGRTATTANPGWTAYTPAWGAATTAPSLGNGTLTGRYQVAGRTCHVALRLVPGSTTAMGSGAYTFGVPFVSADDVVEYVGGARLTAGSTYIGQCLLGPNSAVMNATFPASGGLTAANMSQAAPPRSGPVTSCA